MNIFKKKSLLIIFSWLILLNNRICYSYIEYSLPFLGATIGALCTKKISSKENNVQEKDKTKKTTKKNNSKKNTIIGTLAGTAALLLYKYQNRSSTKKLKPLVDNPSTTAQPKNPIINPILQPGKINTSGNSYTIANMSMAKLVNPENEDLFFELCMKATEHDSKQFQLFIKNSNENVIMTLAPKSNSPCTIKHSQACVYCRKIAGTEKSTAVVADKDKAFAFLSRSSYPYPKCLIIPKTPIVRMSELKEENKEDIKAMIEIIRNIIDTYPEYEDFELEMHNGSQAGQTVHHLHWHFKVPHVKCAATAAFTTMNGYESVK